MVHLLLVVWWFALCRCALRHLRVCLVVLVSALSAGSALGAFVDNNDGTVTDPGTGLTWIRCSIGQTWTGTTCNGTASTHTLDQANALVPRSFAGRNDWRLPNIRELQSIVGLNRADPAIDEEAFPGTPISYFWSSSPIASYSDGAWLVDFGYGNVNGYGRYGGQHVRFVRGGQSFGSLLNVARPTSDYIVHDDGTVTHQPTGLMWQRCSVGQTFSGGHATAPHRRITGVPQPILLPVTSEGTLTGVFPINRSF